jgi:hypothetical protein
MQLHSSIVMDKSLQAYKADRLFLLLGENPLPNCVAAMSLLRDGGCVYLVHTNFTKSQAENLGALLIKDVPNINNVYLLSLGDNQSDGYHIRTSIQAVANELKGRLGMNYTGGTKVMSVHAYRVLSEIQSDAVFSYLDPHRLLMCIDNDYGECIRVRVSPKLSLEQIFRLHGLFWRVEQPPVGEATLPEAASVLAKLHMNCAIAKAWRDWCHRELRRVAKNDTKTQWREEAELEGIGPLSLQGVPEEIKAVLRRHLGASHAQLSLQAAKENGFEQLRNVCEWLDGIWLEHYVLQQIKLISPSCSIHDSKRSFRIQDPVNPHKKWDKFEFDVAFMRDYQLFALSCTTTDKRHLCKQKLIEANLRSRQLGGGEARVALVCCYDWAESLKSELEVETKNRKIAVFGRQDLGLLAPKIAHWVRQNG